MVAAQEEVERPSLVRRHPYMALAIAIVLIVGAIWLMEGGRIGEVDGQATAVAVQAGGGPIPRVGERAPDFTLATLDGGTLSLAELRGRPVLINFWATWCPPCRGEMPDLENVAQEYREAGLVVLGINLQEDRAAVRRYAETLGITFPILLDASGSVAGRYNLTALPTSYFVDREGIVRDLNIGALTARGLRSKVAKVI